MTTETQKAIELQSEAMRLAGEFGLAALDNSRLLKLIEAVIKQRKP